MCVCERATASARDRCQMPVLKAAFDTFLSQKPLSRSLSDRTFWSTTTTERNPIAATFRLFYYDTPAASETVSPRYQNIYTCR